MLTGLLGEYEIEGTLGQGGMGEVFKAHDKRLGHTVAIKVILDGSDEVAVKRLRSEAKALSEVDHPNIVKVLRMDAFGLQCALIMEYVDGVDLASYIKTRGPLSPEQTRQLASQAAGALQQAHKHGIVHRDIKPSNILVTESGGNLNIKIVDFGIARFIDGDEQKLTRTGAIVGSPAYISPEVCQGKRADARSDIYSLGCVLYTALTGKEPFSGETVYDVIFQHLNAGLPKVDCPADPSLAAIIAKCTEIYPHNRFQTTEELLAAAQSEEYTHKTRVPGKAKRKPPAVTIFGAVAAVCILGFLGFDHFWHTKHATLDANATTDIYTEVLRMLDANQQLTESKLAQLGAWNPRPIADPQSREYESELRRFAGQHGEIARKLIGVANRPDCTNVQRDMYLDAAIVEIIHTIGCQGPRQIATDEIVDVAEIAIKHTRSHDDAIIKELIAQQLIKAKSVPSGDQNVLRVDLQMAALGALAHKPDLVDECMKDIASRHLTRKYVLSERDLWAHRTDDFQRPFDPLIAKAIEVYPDYPYDVTPKKNPPSK